MRRRLLLSAVLLLLVSCTPDVVTHNESGNRCFAENGYQEAIDDYRLAQVSDPDRAEPYYNAANAFNRMSQLDAALAQTQQALKTADPGLAERAWYNLGNAYLDAQQWPQAVEAYKEALRLQPDDQDGKHNLELALRRLDEEQQAQQEDQQQEEGDSPDEKHGEQGQEEDPTPAPEEAPDPSVASEGEEGPTPQAQAAQQEAGSMTEEQAAQLLEALLADSQTLRERLRDEQPSPGQAPGQDW